MINSGVLKATEAAVTLPNPEQLLNPSVWNPVAVGLFCWLYIQRPLIKNICPPTMLAIGGVIIRGKEKMLQLNSSTTKPARINFSQLAK